MVVMHDSHLQAEDEIKNDLNIEVSWRMEEILCAMSRRIEAVRQRLSAEFGVEVDSNRVCSEQADEEAVAILDAALCKDMVSDLVSTAPDGQGKGELCPELPNPESALDTVQENSVSQFAGLIAESLNS